jgi:hypothetical protein
VYTQPHNNKGGTIDRNKNSRLVYTKQQKKQYNTGAGIDETLLPEGF